MLTAVFLLAAAGAPGQSPEKTCRAFLAKQGWEAGPFSSETLVLPKAADSAWQTYLALQQENGFTLADYGGKTVLRLCCPILNHPGGKYVYATFYWHEDRIVGGDIMSPALDGFMYGLNSSSF